MSGDSEKPLFDGASAQHLAYLAGWRPWGRRPRVTAIQQQMDTASQRWLSIVEDHRQLNITAEQRARALAERETELAHASGALAERGTELEHVSEALAERATELESVSKALVESEATRSRERDDAQTREQALARERDDQRQVSQGLQKELADAGRRELDLSQRYGAEQMARAQLTTTLVDAQDRLKVQSMQHAATQAALENEQEQRRQLGGDLDLLQAEHAATQIRFALVSRLLAVPPPRNEGIEAFQKLLDDDYMRFASAEASLADEAKALRLLQSIQQELHLMAANPDIFRRTVVGVVGGFSSGKSAFINSFLGKDFKLLSSVTPATVIPSYVYPAQQTQIQAYSFNGGCIDLDAGFYREMSRAFVEKFSFDLKRIMPLVSVGTSMDTERTGNICLMDTPGYNPGTEGIFSQSDRAVAVSHSRKSDVLFWIIGVEANGTIPASDVEFLKEIGFEGRPVYVVLNKADLRSADEIEVIVEQIEDEIELNGITVEGISVYSSKHGKELDFRGKSMQDFLRERPNGRLPMEHVEDRINEVFELYRSAITESIATAKACRSAARALALDLMQGDVQDAATMRSATQNVETINAAMNLESLSELLVKADQINAAFLDAARRVLTPA